jgi:hypothetical protein
MHPALGRRGSRPRCRRSDLGPGLRCEQQRRVFARPRDRALRATVRCAGALDPLSRVYSSTIAETLLFQRVSPRPRPRSTGQALRPAVERRNPPEAVRGDDARRRCSPGSTRSPFRALPHVLLRPAALRDVPEAHTPAPRISPGHHLETGAERSARSRRHVRLRSSRSLALRRGRSLRRWRRRCALEERRLREPDGSQSSSSRECIAPPRSNRARKSPTWRAKTARVGRHVAVTVGRQQAVRMWTPRVARMEGPASPPASSVPSVPGSSWCGTSSSSRAPARPARCFSCSGGVTFRSSSVSSSLLLHAQSQPEGALIAEAPCRGSRARRIFSKG